jgi:hypothetical protein
MKLLLTSLLFSLLLSAWSVEGEGGSFLRDVAGKSASKLNKEQVLNNELLAKAVPLDEYRAKLQEQGLYLPMDVPSRQLAYNYNQGNIKYYYYNYNGDDDQAQVQYYNRNQYQNDDQQQEEEVNEDDYYVSNDSFIDFDGYSLKYAKCQPVQRFSASAVEAGEYSPMVLNDIVIMRLCPSYYCSSSRDYGCLYDYAEYAIDMTDYVRVMLRYKMDQNYQMCEWCQNCVAGRRRAANNYYYYNNYNNDDAAAAAGDDGYNQAAGDDAAAAQGDDGYVANNDDAAAVEYPEGCEDYESYCLDENGYSVCDQDNNANAGDDGVQYMATEEYLDIIGCTQVNGGYFIRPRCNGYTGSISMAVYHDRFCTWYAGDEVDIDTFGLGIDQSIFEGFSGTGCLDCSQSVRITLKFSFLSSSVLSAHNTPIILCQYRTSLHTSTRIPICATASTLQVLDAH